MFTFSLPDNLTDAESLIANIPVGDIPFVEVQGELADKQEILSLLSQKHFNIINSYGYINSSLLTNVIEQKPRLRDEIFDKLHCFITNPLSPEHITLDFGLSYKDIEDELNFLKIKHLRNLYRSIYNENKKICLPIRLPGNAESIQTILNTLKQLMLNKFKICLNIFPHELKDEQPILNVIAGLKYNIGVIRLIYEPATGNYITENFIRFCLDTLKKYSLKNPIIFAPIFNNIAILDREITNICALRKTITKYYSNLA
jgi:hypothetical protein